MIIILCVKKSIYNLTQFTHLCPCVAGVLCDPAADPTSSTEPAPDQWSWPAHELWTHGWARQSAHHGARQALWVLVPAAGQVLLDCPAVWAPQPGQGELRVHVQHMRGPGGDTLALPSLHGIYLSTSFMHILIHCSKTGIGTNFFW